MRVLRLCKATYSPKLSKLRSELIGPYEQEGMVKTLLYGVVAGLLLLLVLFLKNGCTAPQRSTDFLEDFGYTDIQILDGWKPGSCEMKDTYATRFVATSPNGELTSGTVCCTLVSDICRIEF